MEESLAGEGAESRTVNEIESSVVNCEFNPNPFSGFDRTILGVLFDSWVLPGLVER